MNLPKPAYEVEQLTDKNGDPRGYSMDGEGRVDSVTTILGILDKPALKGWAWRIAVEGGAVIPPMRRTVEEQEKALIGAGYGWWQVRNQAALRGTSLHDALSALLVTGEPPELDNWPEEQHGFVQALASYWINEQPEVVESELPVGSKQLQYAGRVDLLRQAKAIKPVDFKSGKTDDFGEPREPFIEAHMQVAGYERAVREQYGVQTESGEIVALCENGKYEVFPALASAEDFESLITAKKFISETEAAVKAWRKENGRHDPRGKRKKS